MDKQALIGLLRRPTIQELYRLEQCQVELSQGGIESLGLLLESERNEGLSVELTQYLYQRPYYWGVCSRHLLSGVSTKCSVPEEFLVYYHNRVLQEIEGMLGTKPSTYIWYLYNRLLLFGIHHEIKVSDRVQTDDLTPITPQLKGMLGQYIQQLVGDKGFGVARSYRVDIVIGELSKQSCKYSQQKIDICQEFQELRETMGKIQQ